MTLLHDGRYYDAFHGFMTRDIEYWRLVAGSAPCRVLELACGTGRVAIPLARDGHHVTGIDVSESMLAQARLKAEGLPIRVVQGDMRELALGSFDRIIVPFNGLRLLVEREEIERCLAGVRRALAPDGVFAFDLTMPRADQLLADKPATTHEHVDPETGTPILATHVQRYDRLLQVVTLEVTYNFADGRVVRDEVIQRVYFPAEMNALMHYNGFTIVDVRGERS